MCFKLEGDDRWTNVRGVDEGRATATGRCHRVNGNVRNYNHYIRIESETSPQNVQETGRNMVCFTYGQAATDVTLRIATSLISGRYAGWGGGRVRGLRALPLKSPDWTIDS